MEVSKKTFVKNEWKVSAIFFDLDNTLIPTRSGDQKAIRKISEVLENNFSFTRDEAVTTCQSFLKAFRRCPDNSQTSLDSWRTYLWREALPARYKQLADKIYPIWLQLRYRYLAVVPEFIQMLLRFRENGILLALISNGPSNAQWEKINKLHISQYFDLLLVSSDLPWEKPNPNIFYAACNFLNVKPAECAMIGDKLETDIMGGHLAGLGYTFWLPLGNENTDLTDFDYPPRVILKNLCDLYKYIPLAVTSGCSSSASQSSLFNQRRNSIVSCSTNSTCESNSSSNSSQHSHQYQYPYHHYHNNNNIGCSGSNGNKLKHNNSSYSQSHARNRYSGANKYRRGGSLPTIDTLNSETENSSDSLFN